MLFDPAYWIILLPAIILTMIAQSMVKARYSKYAQIRLQSNITGAEVAEYILRNMGIHDVTIHLTKGILSDHYNPIKKTLHLSSDVYHGKSIAAAGIAAHEVGHAIQHNISYLPLLFRNNIAPLANIGSRGAPFLIIIGFFFQFTRLIEVGIIFFGIAVLFYIITLPVEFNASGRAVKVLRQYNLLSSGELVGVRKVLSAAALTYIASALTAVLQLLYFSTLSRRR